MSVTQYVSMTYISINQNIILFLKGFILTNISFTTLKFSPRKFSHVKQTEFQTSLNSYTL